MVNNATSTIDRKDDKIINDLEKKIKSISGTKLTKVQILKLVELILDEKEKTHNETCDDFKNNPADYIDNTRLVSGLW